MSTRKADIAELDQWWPPAGPCAFCGHRDRRHRYWDVIMTEYLHGSSVDDIQADHYWWSKEAIEAVLRIRPYRRTR